jgi:hypothetical protein
MISPEKERFLSRLTLACKRARPEKSTTAHTIADTVLFMIPLHAIYLGLSMLTPLIPDIRPNSLAFMVNNRFI